MKKASVFDEIIDNEVEDEPDLLEEEEKVPSSTDPLWVEFVLGKMTNYELVLGSPTTDGLRRVTEKYFGEILESDSEVIDNREGYAIVKHSLVIQKKETGSIIKVSACVDVVGANLPPPYNIHIVATGCTRAEGKALRRALKIRVHTVEELTNSDENEEEENKRISAHINDQQVLGLTVSCKRQNVDLVKFVKHMTNNNKLKNVKQLQNKEAAIMLEKLSYYVREGVPEEFVGYKADWAEKFGG